MRYKKNGVEGCMVIRRQDRLWQRGHGMWDPGIQGGDINSKQILRCNKM